MIDTTIDPSLFSGNVYLPFDTVLKNITCYMELGKKKIETHSDFSSETVSTLIFQIRNSFWEL